MTEFEPRSKGTGIEVFYIRYRKLIIALSIFVLLGFPVQVYNAPTFTWSHKYQFIGYWFDKCFFSLAIPLGMLIYTIKVNRAYKKEISSQGE